jgi:EAL domain-containing protein (putative c-di-GMP-specific phosphodiesterase class I)
MNAQASPNESGREVSKVGQDRGSPDRWLVLMVDDEPEIHEITKLVLAGTSFSGIPVELHSAYSAAEARAFLERHHDTALILLDVVMETDDAGLRLVRHVREQMGNSDLQIVLRTGQPGMAPEREVIPVYDINGYFLKTEMVAQKLQTIVISSLRAYKYIRTLRRRKGGDAAAQGSASEGYQRQALEDHFAEAIDANAVKLLAQPQVNLDTGELEAIEIMPIWRRGDATLGQAKLTEGIRDPELRLKFDEWLLGQGCAWMRSWRSLSLPPFRISLPVLTEDIGDCRFMSIVEQHLSRSELPHGTLDLVVPEAVLLRDRPNERDAFASLKSLGVSVTLVDFGLGLLSLPQLQRLLPARVKIHKSFVRNVARRPEGSAIARSIIALAHTMGLTVIADGVMSEQDLQFFKWEGCDVGQGDLLARPMAVADVGNVICSGTAPAQWNTGLH